MGMFGDIFAGAAGEIKASVVGNPTDTTKDTTKTTTPNEDPKWTAIKSGSLSPEAQSALESMTQNNSQPGLTNLTNLISMGTASINAATLAAQRDAYTQRNQLLEAQRKYGITGGVAAAQAAQFQNNSMQAIANARNQAATQWFQVAGAAMSQLGMVRDKETSAIAQGVLNKIKNQEYVPGTVDELRATMGEDHADWDALKNIEKLSQGDARQLSDLMQMRTQYLGAQDQQAAKTQEQQAAQQSAQPKEEEKKSSVMSEVGNTLSDLVHFKIGDALSDVGNGISDLFHFKLF